MSDTVITTSMLIVLAIYLAATLGLVLAGGSLFRRSLNGGKVLLSCLATMSANFILMLVTPLVSTSLTSILNEGAAVICSNVVTYTITMAVLAGCLTAIVDVPRAMGWALALFANGGGVVAVGILMMFSIGVTGDTDPVLKTAAWMMVGFGLLLMFGGYQVGNSSAAQDAAGASDTIVPPRTNHGTIGATAGGNTIGPIPAVGGGSSFTMMSVSETRISGDPRATDTRNHTVMHDDKLRTPSNAWLVVGLGKDKGQRFDLSAGDTKIGRHSQASVRIVGDDEVGREHCLIRSDGRQFVLFDLASRNHTYLNDMIVTDGRSLRDGDTIRVGQTVLIFKQI